MSVRPSRRAVGAAFVFLPMLSSGCGGSPEQAAAEPAAETSVAAFDAMSELASAVNQVQDKMVALAEAIPEDRYDWRPGEGVRSVAEVFMHVAADNYVLAIPAGTPAPAATGITMDYAGTVVPYENRSADKAEIVADLRASFQHLLGAMDRARDADAPADMFGRSSTVGALWVMTTTHMHEHLGQAIAYARSNGVVPPWSQ
ncbi:MAG: DinB family protein [Gemmatimonadota bacterium]|nr:DinB family protein [Gemmatimonadota bacterium]